MQCLRYALAAFLATALTCSAQTPAAHGAPFTALWDEAMALVQGRLVLDDQPMGALARGDATKLRRGASLLQRAAALEPRNAAPLLMLAKVEQRLGNAAASIGWLRKAHTTEPAHPIIVTELGAALGRQGRHREAADLILPVAQAHPRHPGIQCNLALALLLAGDAAKAVTVFQHLIEIEPERALNHRLLALAIAVAAGRKPAPASEADIGASL
jgi:Flp pilus assembly protein TadD